MRIIVGCQVPVEFNVGNNGFLPCEDYVNRQLVQASKMTEIRLNVEIFNIVSKPIFVTHIINGKKSTNNIEIAQRDSLVALQKTEFVDFRNATEDPILDIAVSSSWRDTNNQIVFCEDTFQKYFLPKSKATSSPSMQPTKQPSKDPWQTVGKIIDSNNTNDNCGYAVDISSDGRKVLLGCPQTTINGIDQAGSAHLYELSTDGSEDRWENLNLDIEGLEINSYTGISVAFASNPDIFAIGGAKGRVRIFQRNGNGRSGFVQQIGNITLDGTAFTSAIELPIDLALGGQRLVVGSSSQSKVSIFDYDGMSWILKKTYTGENRDIYGTSVSLSEDGKILAVSLVQSQSAQDYGKVNIYDVTNGTSTIPIISFTTGFSAFLLGKNDAPSSSISKNGKVCAQGNRRAGGDTGVVKFLDIETKERIGTSVKGESMGDECGKSIALSDDGKTAAIGCKGKVLVAEWDGNEWNVVRKLTTDAKSSSSQGRSLESGTSGYPVAMSKSGDSLIVGSGEELSDGKSGALVYGSPESATPPSITPSPAAPSPPNGGKGKGIKVGKGGKGKGISKSPKGSKGKKMDGKGKKMDGKGKKKNKCKKSKKKPNDYEECVGRNQCNVPSEANALKVTFDVLSRSNGALNESDLNEMLCSNTDTTSRKLRMRFLGSLEVESVFVSNISNTTEGKNFILDCLHRIKKVSQL